MPDPITTTISGVKGGLDVLDKLGILDRVALKLKSNPDKAIARLAQALAELNAGYTSLYNHMVELGSLSFEPDDLKDTRRRLRQLRDGKLRTELATVKGSCSKIENIYQRYLTGWFDRALSRTEARQLRQLFQDLSTMDGRFLRSADALSDLAQQHASELLPLLQAKAVEQAEQKNRNLDSKLAPLTQKLSKQMTELWNLQSKVIEISRGL